MIRARISIYETGTPCQCAAAAQIARRHREGAGLKGWKRARVQKYSDRAEYYEANRGRALADHRCRLQSKRKALARLGGVPTSRAM